MLVRFRWPKCRHGCLRRLRPQFEQPFFRLLQAERHIGRAGPAGAKRGDAGAAATRGEDADPQRLALPVAALRVQAGSQPGRARRERAIAQRAALEDDSGRIRVFGRAAIDTPCEIEIPRH